MNIYGHRDWRDDMRLMRAIAGMSQPARCTHCGKVYDLGKVTVIQRYADCSVWQCPGCKVQVDDRGETGWKSFSDYTRLDKNTGQTIRKAP